MWEKQPHNEVVSHHSGESDFDSAEHGQEELEKKEKNLMQKAVVIYINFTPEMQKQRVGVRKIASEITIFKLETVINIAIIGGEGMKNTMHISGGHFPL